MRPRSEVNACPCYHAFIEVCMFAGLISSSSSAWLPSRAWCRERATRDHRRSSMSPPDAIVVSLAYCATYYSALHRNWSVGGPPPSFRHKGRPGGHQGPFACPVAKRMVAPRLAMVHRVVRVVLLMLSVPQMAALKACVLRAIYWRSHSINENVTCSSYIVDISSIYRRSGGPGKRQ